jgi:hypothetical protein
LCSGALVFGNTSGSCPFRAVTGLGPISVSLGNQQRSLGSLIVINHPQSSTPHSQPSHPTPTTVTRTVNPSATATRTTPVPRVKIPAATHPDPHHKTTSAAPDPYPWHPAAGPSVLPSEEPGASVSAVAVVTTAHGGGASPIPLGLLIGALVVLGGLVTAATRFVTMHVRTEVGP